MEMGPGDAWALQASTKHTATMNASPAASSVDMNTSGWRDGGMPMAITYPDSDREIPHETLVHLGRVALKGYLLNAEDGAGHPDYVAHVRRLWQNLLTTTRSPTVVDKHLSAACNALSVFLQYASKSPNPQVQEIGLSTQSWMDCLDVVLDGFEEGKFKPMRQVLDTLVKVLLEHPDRVRVEAIEHHVLRKMLVIVFLGEPEQHLKASLVVLDTLLKRVASFSRLMCAIGSCLEQHREEWSRRLRFYAVDPGHAKPHSLDPETLGVRATDSVLYQKCSANSLPFILALWMDMLTRDVSSAAVALFKTFSAALTKAGMAACLYHSSPLIQPPWVNLARTFIGAHTNALDLFANFLFRAIFNHDREAYADYVASFQTLGASPGATDSPKLVSLLAGMQVAVEMDIATEQG